MAQTKEGNLISAGGSLIRAASNGDAGAVRTLLAEGTDVDQRGRGGHTALMVAAIFGHVDIAGLLLGAGADVQLLDNLGLTAGDWADRRGSWEVAQLLSNASPAETEASLKNAPGKRAKLKVEAERRNPARAPKTTPQQYARARTEEQLGTKAEPQQREVDEVPQASSTEPKIAPAADALRFMKFHKQIMAAQERRKTEQARREAEGTPGLSPIETNIAPPQDAPSAAATQQTTMAERERRKAEVVPPTAMQSTRIAATIRQLSIWEESSPQVDGEVPTKSDWAATGVDRGLDLDEGDTTVERALAESTRPSMPALKISESFNPPPVKRCPECNTSYDNPLLVYCAYDATKLISADDSMFSYSAASDRSRQTLWILVAIVTVLGASLGYLINNYRSRQVVSSAPIAAISTPPIATQTEQPEPIRNDSPLLSAELSGMEVDVPDPEYPANVRADSVSETITVRVQVNKNGKVVLARSSRGDWRLRAAAVKAAQKATFSPEKVAVRGKVVSGTITYAFVAQTESPATPASQAATQTNSPSPNLESSATGATVAKVGGDYPVVSGPLVGAESKLPQPEYPEKAKSKGIYGAITVVVRVNRSGRVISWRTLEGDSQLRAAALKAAKRATFSPEKLPGNGEVVGSITYSFKPSAVSSQ